MATDGGETDERTGSDDGSEEITRADEEWPVAEQYRVVPPPETPVEEEPPTTVIAQEPVAAPRRPFPSPFDDARVVGVLLALALAIGLAALAGWYLTREDESAAGTTPTETSPTDTQPTAGTTTEETTSTAPTTAPVAGVPDVTGVTLEEARRVLGEAGLRVRVRRIESEEEAGRVLSQLPVAGSEVAENAIVTLTVSGGPGALVVPGVIGETASAAQAELEDAGFVVEIERIASSKPNGTVFRQSPRGGTEAESGSTVSLDVAKPRPAPEPETVDVPRLIGRDVSAARSQLRGLGLRSTVTRVESQRPEGTVIDQSPSPGAALERGETVALTVSSGPAAVAVPDVVGLDEAAARSELEAAGFEVSIVDEPTSDPSEDGLVVGQNPSAGSERRAGSLVTIRVARLTED